MTTQLLVHPSTTTDEATIVRARFGKPDSASESHPLGLTIKLSSARGTTIAVYGDLPEVLGLLDAFGVAHPDELTGRKVHAAFSARRLVGIKPASTH